MKIYFAGDHAGFEMKQKLVEFVRGLGHEVEDRGPFSYDQEDDYVDYVVPMAKRVATSPVSLRETPPSKGEQQFSPLEGSTRRGRDVENRGIVVAGSGQGEMIAANRVRGARAALLCPGPQMVPLIQASRDHNDSNILCIGARFCTLEQAQDGIKVWLETPFSKEERHIRRLAKIDAWK